MGPVQHHRILRQVVELTGCAPGGAAALQAAAARLCRRDWWPAIERACSAQVDSGRVLRIDRLQIDLGRLPPAAWLDAAGPLPMGLAAGASDTAAGRLLQQFESALGSALSDALRQADEVQTDAELLARFLRSGTLPWWADAADRDAVLRAATALQRQPAAAWRGWLGAGGGTGPNEVALQRLVAIVPDTLCRGLLAHWQAGDVDRVSTGGGLGGSSERDALWLAAIDRAALALGQSALRWRRAWWQAAMSASLWPGDPADSGGLPGLTGWLRRLGVPLDSARDALRRALPGPAAAGDGPALAALRQALAPSGRPAALPPQRHGAALPHVGPDQDVRPVLDALRHWLHAQGDDAVARAWRPLLDRLAGAPAGAGLAQPAPPWARLPQAVRVQVAAAWAGAAQAAAAGDAGSQHHQALAAALKALLAADAALGRPSSVPPEARARAPLAQPAVANEADEANEAEAVEAVDAFYLHNAGLVLLWPFIQRFVDRLGLLQPGSKPARWRDEAAARRAAVLLQCVISGDADPPEFQLLLPKLLCGLPLDAALVPDEPLGADETAECEALLVAAIAQATVLRQMSVAGFRGSFGLRAGQLSTRDGHWLLRVERQAYDVVIDRFPWSASLVRLPWMPRLLQVQW